MFNPAPDDHPRLEADTIAISRRLTPRQARHRFRLITAARVLANEGGYEAVSIDAVCRSAQVARGTLYHHFGSKDHLLTHAILHWAEDLGEELRRNPPDGRSVPERLAESFKQVFESIAREPRFFRAAVQALFSSDPGVIRMHARLSAVTADLLDAAVGNAAGVHSAPLCMVLGHVLHSLVVGMASGRVTPEMAMGEITHAARFLLDPLAKTRIAEEPDGERRRKGWRTKTRGG